MVRPVSSLGQAARLVSRMLYHRRVQLKTLLPNGSAIPPVLTRSRARSFAHTSQLFMFLVCWMNRVTLKLCDFGVETLSQWGRDWGNSFLLARTPQALLTLSFSRPTPCRLFQRRRRRFLLQLFLQRPHPVQVFSPDTAQSRKFAGSRDPVAHPVSLTAGLQTLVPASPDLRVCRSPASCAAPHLPGPRRVPSFRTSLPPATASNP